ncbi:Motile sperm domain-containing protein 2 [Rhizophlyctis rosea]|uniref:Motile sperm domain-containing protein 2 n=1 Tax=Rhizophlyctis rosea TaxID=64517 RepID=A0AAD5S8I2_9FUNG|nr:Motile sperm domain-containing protein 2 [Rhizophlyctis rosea]
MTETVGAITQPVKVSQHLLAISPPDFRFTDSRLSVGFISRLTLTNRNTKPVGFKFKTNAPARYSVKPVLGTLEPNASVDVFVRSETQINATDRFLLQTTLLTLEEASGINATTWKQLDRRRMSETFIDCRLRDGSIPSKSLTHSPSQSSLRSATHTPSTSVQSYSSLSSKPSKPSLKQPLNNAEKAQQITRAMTAMTAARYNKLQAVIISAVCLVLGILVPYKWLLHQLTPLAAPVAA